MAGLGIDIVDISRFDKHRGNLDSRFCKKVFTDGERDYLSRKGKASMAGLFAAKEAVAKALGTGFKGFWPKDIEIRHNPRGAPYAVLHGKASEIAENAEIMLSISHTKTSAAAAAAIVQNNSPRADI